jgi:hypothetical protein
MNSIFFEMLKNACQKHNNLRDQTPQPPTLITPQQFEASPVCPSPTIPDIDLETSLSCNVSQVSTKKKPPVYHSLILANINLDKPLPFNVSKVHTLLLSLTDEQYEYECFNKSARLVKFFTINKFPELSSLVLHKVNCNNEVLKCFQEHKFEYFHLWYSSLYDNTNIESSFHDYRLDMFKTVTIKELEIVTSMGLNSCNTIIELPHDLRRFTLKAEARELPKMDFRIRRMRFNAKKSNSILIVELSCDLSFIGTIIFSPPIEPCVEELICHASPDQLYFYGIGRSHRWGHGVVKFTLSGGVRLFGTTFPKCLPTTTDKDDQQDDLNTDVDFLDLFNNIYKDD